MTCKYLCWTLKHEGYTAVVSLTAFMRSKFFVRFCSSFLYIFAMGTFGGVMGRLGRRSKEYLGGKRRGLLSYVSDFV